jgi:hypothetical protein
MSTKKIRLLLFLQILFLVITTGVYSQSIKNTKKFLSYFNGIDNMVSYKKLHENIQKAGAKIKTSSSVSESDKVQLEDYYNLVKEKSDSLVGKITSDLLSKSTRRKMVEDPDVYVNSLNGIFEDIKTASTDFNDKYIEVAGATRGSSFSLSVNSFELPLDKEFAEEIITALLKKLIKNQVKKRISIKPWDDL